MTGKRDKIRSVFLTMLMVVSVFGATVAFSGTAAADVPDVDQDPVEFEAPGGTDHIEIVFDGDATGLNYTLEDRNGDPVNASVNTTLSDEASGRVVLDIGENLNGVPTLTVTASDGDEEELDVTTTATSIEDPSGLDSVEVFKGERIAITNLTDSNGTLEGETNAEFDLNEGGEFPYLSRSTGENSFVGTIDTGNVDELATGDTDYLTFETSGANVTVGVRNLGLSIEADDTDYTFVSGGDVEIEATATSNVASRDVEFRLKEGGDYEDNNKTARIGGDGEVTETFVVDDDGNYTIEVVDLRTDISDETETISVSEVTGDAEFAQGVFSEQRGDVARVTVNMENRDEATLNIGGDDVGYLATLDLVDDDDDGEVTVLFNTYAPSKASSFEVNDDDDEVDVVSVSGVTRPLAAAAYTMNVTEGGVTGEELDRASLNLRERSTDDLRTWTSPRGSLGDLEDGAAIAEYAAAGNLTQDSTIANNDVVVLQLRASGLEGAINDTIASTSASNGAEAFDELETAGVLNFTLYQSTDSKAPNADQVTFELSDIPAGDRAVVVDRKNNTVYMAINSDEVVNQSENLEIDDVVVANMTLNDRDLAGDNALVPRNDRQTATAQFRVVDDELEFDTNEDDLVLVRAAPGQQITGTSTVAPGTEITVSASATGASAFLIDNDTEIQPDGTFAATLDFDNITAGQNFTVDVTQDFDNDPEADGRVQAAATASVTFNDQSTSGEEVRVASATLSEGGFVTIHDSTLQDGDAFGSVRGTSEYLEAGSSSGITVTLDDPISESQTLIAMPHQDTNGNEAYDFVSSEGADDGPYTANGSAVTDSASVTVEEPTPTPTETAEPTPTETAEPTPTETAEPGTEPPTDPPETPEPTDGDGAGFGIVVALIALIGAALLAIRRND
jgi:surface glycoprotein (TIGR04207 family)/PGF-CTERM protein